MQGGLRSVTTHVAGKPLVQERIAAAKEAAFHAEEKAKFEKKQAEKKAKRQAKATDSKIASDSQNVQLPPLESKEGSTTKDSKDTTHGASVGESDTPSPQDDNLVSAEKSPYGPDRPNTTRLWIKVRDRHWLPVVDELGTQVLRKLAIGERDKLQRERDEKQRVYFVHLYDRRLAVALTPS